MSTYYEVLDLNPDAGFIAIDDAYNRLKRIHAGDEPTLRRLEEAWRVLSGPVTRKEYDRQLTQTPAAPAPATAAGAPPPNPRRPATEVIDVVSPSSPSRPGVRPPTEVIDVRAVSPPERPARQHTEELAIPPTPTGRPARPATEAIDIPPAAAHSPRPITLEIETPAARPAERPVTVVGAAQALPVEPGPTSSVPAPAGSFCLIVSAPNGSPWECVLDNGSHVIGRPSKTGPEPSVRLDDRYVSREHALIIKEPGSVFIIDRKSANGTRRNGQRLDTGRPYQLHDGDILEIERFTLRVAFNLDP